MISARQSALGLWWQLPMRRSWLVMGVLSFGALALIFTTDLRSWLIPSQETGRPITAMARRGSMPIVIIAGGELESADAVEFFCEVEGQQIKIIEMLPEGTQVTKGQVVMRLDPSVVNERLAPQQIRVTQVDAVVKEAMEELKIQKNLAESAIAQAQLALTLAELDKKKYLKGDYGVELNEIQGAIALAETDLQEAKDIVEYYRDLVKKGFRTPEQLRAKEQIVKKFEYHLRRDQEKLQVLENFTRERQTVELTAKAEEAVRDLARVKSSSTAALVKFRTDLEVAQATAQLEHAQLERIQRQFDYCTVRATLDGTVVYANNQKARIELGANVHYKQKLFRVPDMSQMQVKSFVHESEVRKVRLGMLAEIKVDAYSDLSLQGEVTEVATFYDSVRQWLSGGVKDYATTVRIDNLPDVGLKPGMTAQVSIRVGELSDNVIVPITAVIQQEGRHICYVVGLQGVERRLVKIGQNTDNFVEVIEGLADGEKVAIDARQRAASQLHDTQPHTLLRRAEDSTAVAASP